MTDNLTYEKMKGIVTNNPDITAQEFYEELKKGRGTDAKIFDLLADAVSLERHNVSDDYAVLLKIVELFAQLDIQVRKSSGGRTMLDIAATNKQADVLRILLDSGKFSKEEKLSALNSAIIQSDAQGFEPFLDYVNHAKILEALNAAAHNEQTNVMRILLDNKRFTEQEKVEALNDAVMDCNVPRVKLLLGYMTGIPEAGIRNLLEIIKESKSSLEEKLKTDSEFKADFNNSDHYRYLSNRVIIALLRSAINKKEERNTPYVAGSNGSNTSTGLTLNDDDIRNLCLDIDRITKQDNTVTSLEDLQKRLRKEEINLQSKREQNAVLEYAIENENLNVIKFLLKNGVTIINEIGQEGRYYVSKIEENKSILCSVVSYTDNSNVEILSTLLQNINVEQSKLDPVSELYILYQRLKDDAFCTAVAENNSVAATVLIQNDQEKIAPCKSAVNNNEIPVVTTNQVVTTLSVESNGNVGNKSVPCGDNKANGFTNPQFSPPNTQETKHKESKKNFHTSLTEDAVGVIATGLLITAAVMIPSVAGAVACGIVAALVVIATGLHVKNFTLPSYKEMRENKVEHVSSTLAPERTS